MLLNHHASKTVNYLLSSTLHFRCVSAFALLLVFASRLAADVTYNRSYVPGKSEEQAILLAGDRTSVDGETRNIEPGGWAVYKIPALPNSRITIRIGHTGGAKFQLYSNDSKPAPFRTDRRGNEQYFDFTAPTNHPIGANLRFRIAAVTSAVQISRISIEHKYSDRILSGVGDTFLTLMGLPVGVRPHQPPKSSKPHSSFQTNGAYDAAFAPATDVVFLYSLDKDAIYSWAEKGYSVYYMSGFREPKDAALVHAGEIQTDRFGNRITIGANSAYMVPTAERNVRSSEKFKTAVQSGAAGVIPEEPEIFANSGYSDAFKQEWLKKYLRPWQEPHTSIENRNLSEKLKAELTKDQIDTILNSVATADPRVVRAIAIHSPVTYPLWGITAPLNALSTLTSVQEVIGQV